MRLLILFCLLCQASFAQTLLKADSLRNLLKEMPPNTARVDLLNQLAFELKMVGDSSIMSVSNEAWRLSKKLKYQKGIYESTYSIGLAWQAREDFLRALEYFLKALDDMETSGYKHISGRCLNSIGNAYLAIGDKNRALEYYLRAVAHNEKYKDYVALSGNFNNLGEVYKEQKDYEKALEYYFKAISYKSKKEHTVGHIITYGNIGDIYFIQDKLDSATLYYSLAFDNLNKYTKYNYEPGLLTNVGLIYQKQKNYAKAFEKYHEAISKAQNAHNKSILVKPCDAMGGLFLHLQQYDSAKVYLYEAWKIIENADYDINDYNTINHLHELYEKTNKPDSSLFFLKKLLEQKEKRYDREMSKEIIKMRVIYELDKKEQENALLKKDKEVQQKELIFQTRIKNGILLIALLTIIMSVVFFYQQKRIRRINRILRVKHEEVEMQAEELKQINEHLEDIVQERTDQILEQHKQIDEYAFINAHRLRAPLASILGLVNLLEHGKMNEDDRIMVSHLKTSSENLDQIVRSITKVLDEKRAFDREDIS